MMKLIMSISLLGLLIIHVGSEISSEESNDGIDAVYTMSNAAPINQVFSFSINRNGRLGRRRRTINTNGAGVNTSANDPLSSQSRVVVYSNFLFVVNAGSDSLSMFAIDPKDATQLTSISVRQTNGRFPVSVTVNSRYVCVLTGGNPAGIRCFKYNRFGRFVVPSLDRTITLNVPQTNPPSERVQ